ncbi:AraC family transcriptional regulator [Streptomyces abyssalis]|uniref:AraC family transcriptional regulator n=1 Tax=Streptomyces abyssalis TaxID=933944 RepID=UPI00085C5193|nr:AraC family transcriptional regulator [Streptomyces abyssalis]
MFETTDLDAGRDFMSAAYGSSLRMKGTEHNQLVRHARYDFGSFWVDDVTLSMETGYDADPLERLAVVQPRAGWVEHGWEGGSERILPGDVAVIAPPDRPFTAQAHNLHFGSVVLDLPLLERAAGFAGDEPGASLRFTGMRPASDDLAAHWGETVEDLRGVLSEAPDAMREPLAVGNVARTLAASALDTFPNTGGPEPTSADGGDATAGAVRRAVAFIEQNAHIDIGLTEIAEAARVSPRALRAAFARHHDTGVLGCLRRVRLDRAHFDLLDAVPGAGAGTDAAAALDADATVAAVAARWGFVRPSNFAAHYHDTFGVSPDDTLLR